MSSREVEQQSAAWFQARRGKLTASVIAALFDKHPFMDLKDVVGILKCEPRKNKIALPLEWGKTFEDVAVVRYEHATGAKTATTGFWDMKPMHLLSQKAAYSGPPFCGGSPDRLVPSYKNRGMGIIEIKSPHSVKFAKVRTK